MSTRAVERLAYTLAEVAEMTSLSLRSLQEGVRAGRVPHIRFGRKIRMTRAQVEQFLASLATTPAAAEVPPEVARIDQWRQRTARRLGLDQAGGAR